MPEDTANLVLEILKRMQTDQADMREHLRQMNMRMGHMETMLARLGRDNSSTYSEMIDDRHAVDALRDRIARIERRLEIGDA